MNKWISFLLIVFYSVTVVAEEKELGVTLDITYVSRFIDKGFDCYRNNDSGILPSLDLDLYNTGFGINVQWFRANSGGFENDEKLDYRVYYYNSFFEDEAFATDYKISWIYHNFTDSPKKVANSQEIEVEFEWPDICPLGIVPRYIVSSEWPAGSNYENHNEGGWVHLFGFTHELSVPGLLENELEQIVHLSADIVYNDGTGANCNARTNTGVDHDWSHTVLGISTDFEISENLTFTPGIYYQTSMDDSVNTSDEYWISSGLVYKF